MKFNLPVILFVCAGGMLGTLLRAGVEDIMSPNCVAAIFACNVLGSFLFALYVDLERVFQKSLKVLRHIHCVGFCGGFTTFSTFAVQVAFFLKSEKYLEASALFFATFATCLAMAVFSDFIIKKLFALTRERRCL